MLLAHHGVAAIQEHLTELTDVAATIATHGARVDQPARAAAWLREDVCFWYKNHASAKDLAAVVSRYRCPAGVEWQESFEEREADEDFAENDYGHYSTVMRVDRRRGRITRRDPYPDFSREDRVFRLDWFIRRGWDVNAVPVSGTNTLRLVKDHHMLFVVTGKRAHSGLAGHDAGGERIG